MTGDDKEGQCHELASVPLSLEHWISHRATNAEQRFDRSWREGGFRSMAMRHQARAAGARYVVIIAA
jgi:hypothetical protein